MTELDFLALVDSCLCTSLRKISRLITRLYDYYLDPVSINIKQLAILLTIHGMNTRPHKNEKHEYVTLSEVGQRLRIEKSTLSRNLRVLEDRGLIHLIQDKNNRKIKRVHLTEQGIQLVLKAYPHWINVQNQTKQAFGETHFNNLLQTINKLTIALDTISNPEFPSS